PAVYPSETQNHFDVEPGYCPDLTAATQSHTAPPHTLTAQTTHPSLPYPAAPATAPQNPALPSAQNSPAHSPLTAKPNSSAPAAPWCGSAPQHFPRRGFRR